MKGFWREKWSPCSQPRKTSFMGLTLPWSVKAAMPGDTLLTTLWRQHWHLSGLCVGRGSTKFSMAWLGATKALWPIVWRVTRKMGCRREGALQYPQRRYGFLGSRHTGVGNVGTQRCSASPPPWGLDPKMGKIAGYPRYSNQRAPWAWHVQSPNM